MKLNSEYLLCMVDEGYALVPVMDKVGKGAETVMDLNEVEVFLCGMLKYNCSQEDLIYAVLDEFEADKETVQEDIEEFLYMLRDKGILNEND